MSAPKDDAELRRGYKTGDPVGLRTVYVALVDDVARLVRRGFTLDRSGGGRVLGILDDDTLRDLVQETFSKAFTPRARQSYDGIQPLRPWVLRIAKNLMIDRLRRGGRELPLSSLGNPASEDGGIHDIDSLIAHDAPFPEPHVSLDERRLQDATRSYIGSLNDERRAFFQLRYGEGHAQHEVATRMGVTRRRVRTLEADVREGLRRVLAAQGLLSLIGGPDSASSVGAPESPRGAVRLLGGLLVLVIGVLIPTAACPLRIPGRDDCSDTGDCLDGFFCAEGRCTEVDPAGRCTPSSDGEDGCDFRSVCANTAWGSFEFRCTAIGICSDFSCNGSDAGMCNDGELPNKANGCLPQHCLSSDDCFGQSCTFFQGAVVGRCTQEGSVCFGDEDCDPGLVCRDNNCEMAS